MGSVCANVCDVLTIEAKSGTETEKSVQSLLERLLSKYDASAWTFTNHVVIEDGVISHSHPVMTLGTRFVVRTPLGVLTTYLHEQLHWYLAQCESQAAAAIEDLRAIYPEVPDAQGGGARDEESTYLHLLLNWLELESLKAVVGSDEAEATLRHAVDGPVYGWVYRRVFDDHARIADIVRRHGLDSVLSGS